MYVFASRVHSLVDACGGREEGEEGHVHRQTVCTMLRAGGVVWRGKTCTYTLGVRIVFKGDRINGFIMPSYRAARLPRIRK